MTPTSLVPESLLLAVLSFRESRSIASLQRALGSSCSTTPLSVEAWSSLWSGSPQQHVRGAALALLPGGYIGPGRVRSGASSPAGSSFACRGVRFGALIPPTSFSIDRVLGPAPSRPKCWGRMSARTGRCRVFQYTTLSGGPVHALRIIDSPSRPDPGCRRLGLKEACR
jgi:hypothetical protein